jgi:hypothetical protein
MLAIDDHFLFCCNKEKLKIYGEFLKGEGGGGCEDLI